MKKGMFFSILGIILVLFLLSGLFITVNYQLSDNFDNEEKQIKIMNNIVENINTDLEKATYIILFRSLLTQLNYVTENGTYIDDLGSNFKELAFNGTLNGVEDKYMVNNTFNRWESNFKEGIKDSNLNIDLEFISFKVEQFSPWAISGIINANLNVTHDKGYASWYKNINVTGSMSIIGFEDPVSIVESYGRIVQPIIPTNTTSWDIANFKYAMENQEYIASERAPNYLQRLEGDFNEDENGIEYIVNPDELDDADLYTLIYNRSAIDHIYWSTGTVDVYRVDTISNGGYPTFRLDNETAEAYNIDNDIY